MVNKMLDKAAIQDYINNDGDHCPYCKKKNILAIEHVQPDETRQVECHDCGAVWYEVLSVTNIMEAS
jgi:phage FluMu protein Com